MPPDLGLRSRACSTCSRSVGGSGGVRGSARRSLPRLRGAAAAGERAHPHVQVEALPRRPPRVDALLLDLVALRIAQRVRREARRRHVAGARPAGAKSLPRRAAHASAAAAAAARRRERSAAHQPAHGAAAAAARRSVCSEAAAEHTPPWRTALPARRARAARARTARRRRHARAQRSCSCGAAAHHKQHAVREFWASGGQRARHKGAPNKRGVSGASAAARRTSARRARSRHCCAAPPRHRRALLQPRQTSVGGLRRLRRAGRGAKLAAPIGDAGRRVRGSRDGAPQLSQRHHKAPPPLHPPAAQQQLQPLRRAPAAEPTARGRRPPQPLQPARPPRGR